MVEISIPGPKQQTTRAIDEERTATDTQISSRYKNDSLEVATRFATITDATRAKYQALLQQAKQELARAIARGKNYRTQVNDAKAKIAALEALQASEQATVSQDRFKALEALIIARNGSLTAGVVKHQQQLQKIEQINGKAEATTNSQVKNYGNSLAWFTIICLIILILSIAIDEIHKKGSGIQEMAQPTQYYFSESIAAAFWGMLNEKINYYSRAWINKLAARTPEPEQPRESAGIWEPTGMQIKKKIPTTNPNGFHYTQAPSSDNDKHLNNSASPLLQAQERKYIGFQEHPKASVNNEIRYEHPEQRVLEVDRSMKPCLHCQQMFKPKTTWQKYCGTECRLAFHEKKHGTAFSPGQYHKSKNRKV